MRLLPRLGSYDAALDRDGHFLGVVAFRSLGNLHRDQRCRRRRPPTVRPLADLPDDADPRRLDLRLDVAVVVERLPADLRRIALMLQRQPITDVARDLRLSRGTIYARIGRIRDYFEKAGLGGMP